MLSVPHASDSFKVQDVSCMDYEEMIVIFQPLIVNNLNVREVLPLLTFLKDHDRIYAVERISPKQAVIRLLEELKSSTEFGKWHKFIEALGACGYEYIVKNIRGYGFVDLRYQGCYIKSLTPKLSKIINPVELLPHLQAEEVIGQNDREEIEMEDRNFGSIAAAIMLLRKIPEKHSKWYVKFLHVLRKVGYEEVANDLNIPDLVEPYRSIETSHRSSIYSSIAIEFEESIAIFKPLIVKNLIVGEVLPYLTFLDDHASIYAVERVSPRDAVILVLEKLKRSKEPGKWYKFIETLSACGYEYIVKNMKGYKFACHNYQEDYVKSLTPKLSKVLQPMVLLPHLHAEGVISQSDRLEIDREYRNRGNIAASILLLNRIPRKSVEWYTKFTLVLRNEGFDDIAEDLDIPSLTGSEIGRAKAKTPIPSITPMCAAMSSSRMRNDQYNDTDVKPPLPPRRMKKKTDTTGTYNYITESSTKLSQSSLQKVEKPNLNTTIRKSELKQQTDNMSTDAVLLAMPDNVLVRILRKVSLLELLQSVNRTCQRLHMIIYRNSVLWEDFVFDTQLKLNASSLANILVHSWFLKRFIIRGAKTFCSVPEIDILLTQTLASETLYWLDISGMPVSTLCFLKQIPNLKILNVSNCSNLKDVDFTVISCCKKLDQLYVSYTEVQPKTVLSICSELQLTTLDICGINITIDECDCILKESFNALLILLLSFDNIEDRLVFQERIKPTYKDVSISILPK